MIELLIDPNIRVWVFLPIVVITFLVGIFRQYASILISSHKSVKLEQVQDSQIINRSRLLRENGQYIPKEAYDARKHFLNDIEDGYFNTRLLFQRRFRGAKYPLSDLGVMMDGLKSHATNTVPMLVVGSWINSVFSGFVATKVPFPLTLRFKSMLQRGIDLEILDASWVSSVSWYFLNIFGLRSIYLLVFEEGRAADEMEILEISSMVDAPTPPDPKETLRLESEALAIHQHTWALSEF